MMRRLLLFLSLMLVSTEAAFAVGGNSRVPFADPYILVDNGKYYAYGTYSDDGIQCFVSDNLRTWTDAGLALNKAQTTESRWFWAPEVYKMDSLYYMYYSANEHLFVATSTSPTGPFKQKGGYMMQGVLGDEKCIDSSVFTDDDGTQWLFFVRFTDGNCIWQCRLDSDHVTPIASTLKKCIAVSQGWEQVLGRVNEGPFVIKHNGKYYLTYSANDYQSPSYGVGYALASKIDGVWSKSGGNPILQGIEGLVGTGHHSFFTDLDGNFRIVFHAHNSTTSVNPRLMYIGSMKWMRSILQFDRTKPILRPTTPDFPYNLSVLETDWGFQRGNVVMADLNNDGRQDIIAAGSGRLRTNSSSDTFNAHRFTQVRLFSAPLNTWNALSGDTCAFDVADAPCIVPCELNGDGILDVAAFDAVGSDTSTVAYHDGYGRQGLFLGRGDGTFVQASVNVGMAGFDFSAFGAADVADFNADGYPDIVGVGYRGDEVYNLILLSKGSPAADGTLSYEAVPFNTSLKLSRACVKACDFNVDGFTDFIVSANVIDSEGQTCLTDIYINSPSRPGTFTPLGLAASGVKSKGYGSIAIADFNADGLPDFYLAGTGDEASGELGYGQHLYINQGTAMPSFKEIVCDVTKDVSNPVTNVPTAAGVIDWDGDGAYDLLLPTAGHIYHNDGSGKLLKTDAIPTAKNQAVAFPDWDGDGVKDYLVNGVSYDTDYLSSAQRGKVAIVALNYSPLPSTPEPPVALKAETADGGFRLSWTPALSAKSTYTYEVYIKDANGKLVNNVNSFTDGDNNGLRKTVGPGNAGYSHSISFLPKVAGRYTWGVQAISPSFDGSPFAEGGEISFSGSTGIAPAVVGAPAQAVHFNTIGQRVGSSAKGIHIVRLSDGKAYKQVVK